MKTRSSFRRRKLLPKPRLRNKSKNIPKAEMPKTKSPKQPPTPTSLTKKTKTKIKSNSRSKTVLKSAVPDSNNIRRSARLNPSMAKVLPKRKLAALEEPRRRRSERAQLKQALHMAALISSPLRVPKITVQDTEETFHSSYSSTQAMSSSSLSLKLRLKPPPSPSPYKTFSKGTFPSVDFKTFGGRLTKTQAELAGTLPRFPDRQSFIESEIQRQQPHPSYPSSVSYKPLEIKRVFFGLDYEIKPWYSAPYPEEYFGPDGDLWICEHCLKYMRRLATAQRHLARCLGKPPPGDEIYRDERVSVFEVNGLTQSLYCQNLCLLAKMFLDHKTLYWDVAPFLFYVLVEWKGGSQREVLPGSGRHLYSFVGYFSKEKCSPVEYNLSCILTMPQHQRKGYGAFLIELSYLLTRVEGKRGSPEKPLSDLGLLAYVNYWKWIVIQYLSERINGEKGQSLDLEQCCTDTGMSMNDLLATLEYLEILKLPNDDKASAIIVINSNRLAEWRTKLVEFNQRRHALDPDKLLWAPYFCIR